jgi:carbon starvation protein CstA
MTTTVNKLIWAGVVVLGAISFGIVALTRGEPVNAAWLVMAAACVYFIAYRFYALFIADKVLGTNAARQTPAYRRNDGLDYVPTNRYVLFGHHFAAIAGAGPLVGPVLAAQMGYLPGTLWILAGVVFAGAVQDMTVLFLSTRRDGRSLGDMIRSEMGPVAGSIAGVGVLLICIIVLSVLALIVVKALVGSPWGTFTVFCTIPIALLMGIYSRFIRPGRIAEMSAIGVVLLLAALVGGQIVAETPELASMFNLSGSALAVLIIFYGFVASVLPVWLLLAPRDYLSTFMKVGTVVLLAIGIMVVRPDLQMAAVTKFIDGSGPVWAGSVFPFLFITIACGAVSGWHSLISSGTTPKMIENEQQIRFIGYGAMLMESFVAIMAMIAATVINPGVYFAMNSAGGLIGGDVAHAAQVITGWGFTVTPDMLTQVARDVGETTILSRTGGAPTLAVGMASILSGLIGGKALMGLWYHLIILDRYRSLGTGLAADHLGQRHSETSQCLSHTLDSYHQSHVHTATSGFPRRSKRWAEV